MHPMARPKSRIWRAQLNGSRLHFLRRDPDFLALIKMGRVVNATLFGVQSMADHAKGSSPMEMRQSRRAFWVHSGYLHEGLVLVKSLQGRYLGLEEFEPLRVLIHDKEYKKAREYIKAVRNMTAFHLDEYDTTTRETMSKMQLTWYDLMSGDDENPMNVYFEFADIVDMGHLVFKFSNGREWMETAQDLNDTILKFALEFSSASSAFVTYLMRKTNIREHVKGGYTTAQKTSPSEPDRDEGEDGEE
jgi:hypothetical protein